MLRSPLLKEHVIKDSMKEGKLRTDSTVQDDNSRSGNDTDADDAYIRPIYDEEPMAEEIDVLETMNIELEHSVATLRKENETLKQHYKDLYDSIKITRSKTTEQTTSLLASNTELKAQIQEKIFTGHRFSPNKTSAVYEKTSPRSDLRWKPTGRIFKSVGLRWIPTGKLFDSCTSKVDSEPPHGSNVDIPNIHECKQTLDVSAGTSINVQKEQSLDLSAGTLCNVNKENLRVWLLKKLISQKPLSKWIHR
ncbi:hypothetical protein Tco_1146281 [Tanacetum coccineum]